MNNSSSGLSIKNLLSIIESLEKSNASMIEELRNVKELAKHPDNKVRKFHSKRTKQLASLIKSNKAEIKKAKENIEVIQNSTI